MTRNFSRGLLPVFLCAVLLIEKPVAGFAQDIRSRFTFPFADPRREAPGRQKSAPHEMMSANVMEPVTGRVKSGTHAWEKPAIPSEGIYAHQIVEFDGKLYLAGNLGRVYVSHDLGDNWIQIFEQPFFYYGGPTNTPVTFATLRVNEHMIFSYGNYSTDGGLTWKNIYEPTLGFFDKPGSTFRPEGYFIDGKDIYVYTFSTGVYKTSDFGATWTQMLSGLPSVNYWGAAPISALIKNNGVLYCHVTQGYFTWGDDSDGIFAWKSGKWQPAATPVKFVHQGGTDTVSVSRVTCFVAETDQGYFFSQHGTEEDWQHEPELDFDSLPWKPVRISKIKEGTYIVIGSDHSQYLTNNNGTTWSPVALNDHPTYGSWFSSITAYDETAFVAGTTGFYWSRAPFTEWTYDAGGTQEAYFESWGNQQSIVRHNNQLAAISTIGIYRSPDNGETWQSFNNTIRHTWAHSLVSHKGKLFLINVQGLMRSDDDGETWQPVPSPIASQFHNYQRLFSSDGSLFLAVNDLYGSRLFRSQDSGSSWQPVWEAHYDSARKNNDWVYATTVVGDNIYLGTEFNGMYRSPDNGETWVRPAHGGLPTFLYNSQRYYGMSDEIYKVGEALYLTAGSLVRWDANDLYRSTDEGETWSLVTVDSTFSDWSYWQSAGKYSQLLRIGNSLLLSAFKGYYAVPPLRASWTPARVESYFYVSHDDGTTWSLVDDIDNTSLTGIVTGMMVSGPRIFAGLGWLGGGMRTIAVNAFGIQPPVEILVDAEPGARYSTQTVDVRANSFRKITSAKFAVQWNPEQLRFKKAEAGQSWIGQANFDLSGVHSGNLHFSWQANQHQSCADSAVLFSLTFWLTGTPGVSAAIELDKGPVLFLDSTSNEMAFALQNAAITIDSANAITSNELVDETVPGVFPNPFPETVTFRTGSGIWSLEIFSSQGNLVEFVGPLEGEFTWDARSFPDGLYFYRVSVKDKAWSGKILKR